MLAIDEKTLNILEYPKILEQLEKYTSFKLSAELVKQLRPTPDREQASYAQNLTKESVLFHSKHNYSGLAGAHDIRPIIELARREGTATPQELLDVKDTLIALRSIKHTFERIQNDYPRLSGLFATITVPSGVIESISRAISDHGEILDNASLALSAIRHELKIVRDRLQSKLQHYISDPATAPLLQEPIITQREGRYVLPVRADFKGRIKAIIHDQSSSGATLFIEPLPIVELNNQNRQLQLDERDEEHRILFSLTSQLANHLKELETGLDALAKFDFALACGKYALALGATQPDLVPIEDIPAPVKNHPGTTLRLIQARHPLLDPNNVVPIDIEFDDKTFVLVITGPNTGGKTVSLKTVGLLALMAQSGLHIPAAPGSTLSVFQQIFADIGDEQSIEQSLSTFSGHVKNIVRILAQADSRSLIILDELGAGTDPQEGAALARAILTYLLNRKITTLVTTHHPELKLFAHKTPGVTNACVEFDLETLQPTYHLTIGLPGRSNAIAIAQRLGMPSEIIESARNEINPQELQSQDLLDEIYHQRELTRQAHQQAESNRKEAESLRLELSRRLENIEKERQDILYHAEQEVQSILSEIQAEARKVRKQLSHAQPPIEDINKVEDQISQIEEKVEKQIRKQHQLTSHQQRKTSQLPKIGDKVQLRSLGTKGILTQMDGDEIEVQVGMLRIRSDLADIIPIIEEEAANEPIALITEPPKTHLPRVDEVPSWEIDVRGKTVEEVLEILEPYIASALYAGLPFVRIIHGKGSGRLRQAIRAHLKNNPHILSFKPGDDREGGEGVTVVKLN